jgi:hypothetical protein
MVVNFDFPNDTETCKLFASSILPYTIHYLKLMFHSLEITSFPQTSTELDEQGVQARKVSLCPSSWPRRMEGWPRISSASSIELVRLFRMNFTVLPWCQVGWVVAAVEDVVGEVDADIEHHRLSWCIVDNVIKIERVMELRQEWESTIPHWTSIPPSLSSKQLQATPECVLSLLIVLNGGGCYDVLPYYYAGASRAVLDDENEGNLRNNELFNWR